MDINAKDFFGKYKAVLTNEQFNRFEDLSLGITKTLEYSDEEIADLNAKLKILDDFNEKLYKTADHNNKGIALEKEGNTEAAIKIYEENIQDGFPAIHSFERLMIIYRKLKRYNQEVRVIEQGINLFIQKNPKVSLEWTKRLIKAKKLQTSKL